MPGGDAGLWGRRLHEVGAVLNSQLPISIRKTGFGPEAIAMAMAHSARRAGQFAIGVLVARLVGVEGRGVVAALTVPANLATNLSEMGIRQAAALHLGKGDYSLERVQSTLAALLPLATVPAILLSLLYFELTGIAERDWLLRLLAVAVIPLSLATSYASGILLGRGRIAEFRKANWRPVAINLILLVILGFGLRLGVVGVLLAAIGAAAVSSVYALWIVAKEQRLAIGFDREVAIRLNRTGLSYAASLLVLTVNYRLMVLLLTAMRPIEEVGLFAQALVIAELVWEVPAAINALIFSRGVAAVEKQDFSRKVMALGRLSLIAAIFTALLIAAAASSFFPFLYGRDFAASAPLCIVLLPGAAMFVLFKLLSMDMAGRGKPALALLVMAPTLIVNVALGSWLIGIYGAMGAAVSSSICFILATVAYSALYSHVVRCSLASIFVPRFADLILVRDALIHRKRR